MRVLFVAVSVATVAQSLAAEVAVERLAMELTVSC